VGSWDGPIFSTRADDPDLGEAIERFVVGLAERIDALQDAEGRGDLKLVASLVEPLGSEAEANGFGPFAVCAARLESACAAGRDDAAHRALVELTEIALRIRLGHRGAS
jgi:hypothetical protein